MIKLLPLTISCNNAYRILNYSKYRYSTSLKNTNSSFHSPAPELSNIDFLDYLQEAKPSRDYNDISVILNFQESTMKY